MDDSPPSEGPAIRHRLLASIMKHEHTPHGRRVLQDFSANQADTFGFNNDIGMMELDYKKEDADNVVLFLASGYADQE